ncbi:hypothetical protein JVX91_01735 [Pseudomonas sp. PDNC002]|uniref:pilus assembly protein n=1 Tax=Pseudomonas sp. PDNC002 TaxID=2811422 RepID=UPI001963449A|nr:PilC/PilY family type IV pilus protein [Pseudomonas sp. PDNC002]QRY79865.1 hypothetical protein JVX91_01735 [Pseudomonas sp. PDNC002]
MLVLACPAEAGPVSQTPLQIGSGAPGNLVVLPSTAHAATAAAANPATVYAPGEAYIGYFDAEKCYAFRPAERYFQPSGAAVGHACSRAWSGNFLNWASAQAVDVFRAVMTGGDRLIDSADTTVLQKGRNLASDASFPDRGVPAEHVGGATPYSGFPLYIRIAGQDRSLLLSRSPEFPGEPQDFEPGALLEPPRSYRIPVRVQVCVDGQLEDNCQRYGAHFKPEGLLQQFSEGLRFSVFGRSSSAAEALAALRVPQKFVGPQLDDGRVNPEAEWSPRTGVFVDRFFAEAPDATGRGGGAINYLNRFDEIQPRTFDDVGELFHAATRYLGSQESGHVDPLIYACQRNAILGVGSDGSGNVGESLAGLAADDPRVDLKRAAQRVAILEGASRSGAALALAGLAYDTHVGDLRPELPGRQSASTYWLASPGYAPHVDDALWLATKYGGFLAPQDYRDEHVAPLAESWWKGPAGRPANLFLLSAPQALRAELKQAFAHAANAERESIGNLSHGGGAGELFSAALEPKFWSGDLSLWRDQQLVWSAAEGLDRLTEAQLTSRNILTVRPVQSEGAAVARQGVPFIWSALDDEQRRRLGVEPTDGPALLAFLRGSRALERNGLDGTLPYRQRRGRLGDIVNSRPVHSWHDAQPYGSLSLALGEGRTLGSTYREFLDSATYRERTPLVAVGANDGMLHGFDASDGRELFAYVPAAIFAHLRELADPGYAHRFYVDGSPSVGNAWVAGQWRTLLVGSTGAGGRSVFALDVTNPQAVQPGSVLWEFTHPDLGYTLGRPALVALGSGRFVVIVSSGAREPEGQGGDIWLLDAADGRLLKRISLPGAGDLGAVTAISSVGDVTANRLYVGDSRGNLWRVDLAGEDGRDSVIPSSLAGKPLFRAQAPRGAAQGISAPVAAALDRNGQVRLIVGTGRLYRVGDSEPPLRQEVESLYGVLDEGRPIAGRSQLQAPRQGPSSSPPGSGSHGWYLDLPADGTRVIEQPQLRDGQFALFNLLRPGDDPCGDPFLHRSIALDLDDGGALNAPLADLAGDSESDQGSGALVRSDGNGDLRVSTLDREGRPQVRTVELPHGSERRGWWESR